MKLRPANVPGMTVVAVRELELPAVLETTGQISFDDRRVSTIISRVNGRIEDTVVSLWDDVKKGEPVVTLYSPDYMTAEAEYLQASATAKLSVGPELSDSEKVGKAMLEAAKRKLELLGLSPADIKAIRAPSAFTVVRAPISGTVVQKQATRGAAVNPGDVMYSLGTLERVWITGDIYETDLARVREGQELEAVIAAYPAEVFKGTINRVSPNIDPNTHTLQIRCDVENADLKLKPQMLARVRIITKPGTALVVPQEALVFETDSYYAFVVVAPEQVARRRVTVTSWNEQGYARVLSGLQSGEQVIKGESIQVNALWHEAHGESS